ncbi:primosomal protein N' [Nocardia sp. NBC_00416]|uniref:primosomal protein N' family DNA-binding protein n=1 Tax=Nocardia sp. NBC_00416 TaxID=2975991 RepID=UPI002E226AAD
MDPISHPIARVLPLLTPAHLDRDFDYLVPPELDEIARPGVRVRVRFAGRLVDGYLLSRHTDTEHTGKLVRLERVVSAERVLTPEILRLATTVAARCAGTRADVLRLAIPPRHARVENGGAAKSVAGKNSPSPSTDDSVPEISDLEDGDAPAGASVADNRTARSDGAPVPSLRALPGSLADHSDAPTAGTGESRADLPTGTRPHPASDADVADTAGASTKAVGIEGVSRAGADSARGVPGVGGAAGAEDAGAGCAAMRSDAVAEGVPRPDAAVAGGARSGEPDGPGRTESASGEFPAGVDAAAWGRYRHGEAFLTALMRGRGARAAWQALPGEDWARRVAELAAVVVAEGRSAILMVPDQRDLDRVLRECERLVGDSAVGLSAGLGPAARYRRWLAVLRGTARVVVGTRSAVFAPAADLGLVAIWDDGDDTYAEPRAPYPHAREVAMLRAHDTGAAFVAAGFARTAEVAAIVESGWAHDLLADRATVRSAAPRISAPGDTDIALERDPNARAVRIPGAAFAAARQALAAGTGVLVQVPRRGYVPALSCTKCRTPARCRQCAGPLSLPGSDVGPGAGAQAAHSPLCRWCGRTEAAFRCPVCGGRALRAVVVGAARTAEELGRAFPGVPVRGSSGAALLDTVPPGPQVVVATVGAEPLLAGGYGVGLLLDGWALLGRADLRAAEDTLRRWLSAAALVRSDGQVLVMADPGVPTVQALLRWDPAGHAAAELAQRAEVGFPPAVRMAAVDGTAEGIAELLAVTELPAAAQVLGPVPLPAAARLPSGARGSGGEHGAEVERVLLRTPRAGGAALARALTAAQAIRSSQRADSPLRVQIDPLDIG